MAKRHSSRNGSAVAAAGYLRRSTNKQEKSIPDQRREIKKYAAEHNYRIIRWYQDEISGDATEQRRGFQEMHAAACAAGRDFDAIIVWDQDRFGRFSSHEASYWTFPLAKAGVRLVTVCDGPIDWDDFTAWLTYSVNQHSKHQFLRDLSKNVARSQITNAEQGYSCGQQPPYGYDRMLIDEQGSERQRIYNGDRYVKPRSWRVVWVPSDDPLKIRTVEWLFKTYAESDIGYRALADQLNQQQVLGPTGGKWFDSSVRALLENEAYIGTFVWNKRRMGKYHRVVNGKILERDRTEVQLMPCGKPTAKRNPSELWMRVEQAHQPLIDRATFDQVQNKIQKRKRSADCSYQTHTKRKDREAYLLTGLLYCQHCGRKMHGTMYTRKKKGKTYRYQRYICSSYTRGDRSCGHHAIRQDQIVQAILGKIRTDLLQGDRQRLEASLRQKLRQRQQPSRSQADKLRRQLRKLDQQIDSGAERVLTAPDSLLDVLTVKLQAWKQERDQVAAELRRAEQVAKPVDVKVEAARRARKAWALLDELQASDPPRMRELLHRAIDRIELRFTACQQGKRRQYQPTGGKVVFREDEFSGFANRGDWI